MTINKPIPLTRQVADGVDVLRELPKENSSYSWFSQMKKFIVANFFVQAGFFQVGYGKNLSITNKSFP